MNISEEESEGFHDTTVALWNIILSTFYILIFVIAVPGNALALWAFFHQKSTSPSKVFLRNLALADIFYVLILPMRIVYHLSDSHWPFGHILCKLSGFLFYLNMYCSLYLMSFISLDRFLAVVVPIRSQSIRKPVYANVAVGILWVTVIISMIPTLFSKQDSTNFSGTCAKLYLETTSPTALVSTIVAFAIPLTTIVVSYILILLKLRTVKQQEQRPVKDKAVKMIILIVMNFLLAFVPYHVCRIIYIKSHNADHITAASLESLGRANQITSALTCVSGVLDPVMYFFLNRAYKDTFLKLFCRNRERDQ
ncbi:uracil nucleotide/cysteinyl leukotriene receptor [Stegastes partitus]|uniref:Uracil nucleotide/cysteinyl leukotriene receptor n=1 Tax=Stegastes partitus TaxID=144197 RepID=A0A9Y4JXA1_9TELE|nr:PREDICTED: uracil nucleotide/cysteinyl leukotriene receptor-like [Stegastes partitus]